MKTRLLGGGGQLWLYLCGGWLWVCCVSWIRDMGSWGLLQGVLPAWSVRVIALVARVSGIGRVCLAINTVGCLGAAQIIISGCVAGASLDCFFFFFFFFVFCFVLFSC